MNILRFARAPYLFALLLTLIGLFSTTGAAQAGDEPPPTPRDLHISTACRVYDSRLTGGPLASGAVRDVDIPAACAIPADAVSVIVTLTVVDPPAAGYIQVYQGGTTPQPTSVLTFKAGDLLGQIFVVLIGTASGAPDLQVKPLIGGGGSTHFAIDVLAFNGSGAPSDILLDNSSVLENQPAGTLVGNLSTIDPDFDDTHEYFLVEVEDDEKFQITGSQLLTNAVLDREEAGRIPVGEFKIRVRSADNFGVFFEKEIIVTADNVNDAPSGTDGSVGTGENTDYTFAAADFGFTDVDVPANALQAVVITTLPADGTLELSNVAVTAGQSIPVADIPNLTFTPATGGNGSPYTSFTFQVQDDGGTANGGIDLDPTPKTLSINVNSVNDAPVGTNGTVTLLEDGTRSFTAADFGFTDPNDTPANAFLAVTITTLPAAGTLTLSGNPVTAGQSIQIGSLGLLLFTPVANANGSPYTAFTFQVQDDGGTLGGGLDLDQSPNTLSLDVTPVNDPPAGTNGTVTTLEGAQYTFTAADFGFTDPVDSPAPNALQSVVIATLPAVGSLTLSGSPFAAGTEITVADITAGNLKFAPAASASGAPYASFTFQVRDDGGTANSGIDLDASPNTLTIDVTAVNSAPAGTNNTVVTLEDTQYTFTVADFGFTDPTDTPADAFQSVVITTLPALGSLTLSGAPFAAGTEITVANVTAGNLKFTPAANGAGVAYTSFTFQVRDDGGTVNGGVDLDQSPNTLTVNVTAVNDAPAGTDGAAAVIEDVQYTVTAANFGFTDPLDIPANALASVVITTLPAAGSLTLSGAPFAAGTEIPVASITAGDLKFTPAANASGSPYTSFTFQVRDDGGTANSGVDLDASPNTLTFNVTAVNDAPAGTDGAVAAFEDTQYTFTAADFGFTDPLDTPANALASVVITTLPGTGTLTLSGSPFAAGTEISLVNITAGNLRFTPAANTFGSPYTTFTFQVRDDGGTANGGINLDASPNTLTVNVTAINDAPAGTNGAVSTFEETQYTFTAADFGFTDPNDTPANALASVVITTLPAAGTLTLSGSPFAAGTEIPVASITAGNLKFTPAANGFGTPYTTFTFQVRDDGGTANGGIDLDASPNTLTVNVTAINDAPAGTDNTVVVVEDAQYTFTVADFGFTDPLDSPANTLQSVVITTLPGLGTLTLSGSGFAAGTEIPVASITAGNLKFVPAANGSGSPYTTFTFQVRDNGGTTNGGIDLDASPNTITVNVTPVNDAPAGTDNTVTTPEDVLYTFTAADFGFTDPIDIPANTLASVVISTLPGAGSLTLSGSGFAAGTEISLANITAGNLKFLGAANAFGSPYTTFTFRVRDNGGTAGGGIDLDPSANTMTINVTPVPDPPIAGDEGSVGSPYAETAGNTILEVTATPALTGAKVVFNGNILTNDTDPDGPTTFTVTLESAMAGAVVSLHASNGTFTYVPPAGFTGVDSFTYRITDPEGLSDTGVVFINVKHKVWYVKNNQAAGGLGRSTDPFDTLAEAETASAAGDTIYVFEGDTTTLGQSDGITLKSGQRLLGEAVVLAVPAAVTINGTAGLTLRSTVGNLPRIENDNTPDAAGEDNGVSVPATAASSTGVEIRGLMINGFDNAIDVTATGANNAGVTIQDVTVAGASLEGIDVNSGTTGTTTVAVTNSGLTSTGNGFDARSTAAGALRIDFSNNTSLSNASGVVIDGSGGGTTTITGFANNVVNPNTVGTGISVTSAIFDATTAAGFQTVSGGTTTIGIPGNGVGAGGLVMGSVQGDLSFTDLEIYSDSGAGLRATSPAVYTGSAGLRIVLSAGVGNVVSTGGPAVDLATVTATLPFQQVSSTNSPTTGIALNGLLGSFSASSGSITGPTTAAGTAFQVGSSNATISYPGNITTTIGKGVDLTSNTGSTIDLTGTLSLSSAANTAFNATGGGTITATVTTNTLATTTGTALNVANTTIGAGGLKFRSISAGTAASGPANGIVLNNTGSSGGLTVSGTGSAGTGGTIQRAGTGISLTSTRDVSIAYMQLNDLTDFGIRGSSVVNFTMNNTVISGANGDNAGADEGSMRFTELTGTASISNSSISGSVETNVAVVNTTGTLNRLTVSGTTFGANNTATGDDGLYVETQGTAVINATVQTSFFTSARGDLAQFTQGSSGSMDVVVQSTAFSDNHPSIVSGGGGVIVGGTNGSMTFNVNGNTFRDSTGTALAVSCGNAGQSCVGRFENNQVGLVGTANSGSSGGSGIAVVSSGGGTMTALVNNNQIRQYNNHGILLQAGQTLGNPTSFNVTVTNNTVSNPGTINTDFNGIHLNNGTVPGENFTSCVDIRSNTISGAGKGTIPPNNGDYRLRQRQSTTVRLPGYGGANNNDAAVVTFVSGNQTTVSTGASSNTVGSGGGGFVGGASCVTPP
jgi:Bacterial Ig domain/Bacterial cadherin-like domain/Cadherin-like